MRVVTDITAQKGIEGHTVPRRIVLNRNEICAVVVTFNPDDAFAGRVDQMAGLTRGMVVVDNGSCERAVTMLNDSVLRLGCKLIMNDKNLGVAAALNQGVLEAIGMGFQWALLFDQDTDPAPNLVDAMSGVIKAYTDPERIAVVGSNYTDVKGEHVKYEVANGRYPTWKEVTTTITSGSLISLCAFQDIGPFREEFFIDFVDHEYCLRARCRGWRVLVTGAPVMAHSIGSPTTNRILGVTLGTTNHPSQRCYFGARNCLVLLREYGLVERGWAVRVVVSWAKRILLILAFEDAKLEKLKAIALGLRDGMLGRLGGPRTE